MRRVAVGIGWQRPRPWLVVASLLAAGLMRSIVRVSITSGLPAAFSVSVESIGRVAAALGLSLAVSLGMAAAVQLSRERSELMAALLAEQARLLELAATMEQDIRRAETELRVKAIRLLEPTIPEIRCMLHRDLEPNASARIADRIWQSVDDVVRPVSRELAVSPSVALGDLQPLKPARLNLLMDRMDVPRAFRPGWVFILTWISIAPAVVLVGLPRNALVVALVASLAFVGVIRAVKLAWPRSLRSSAQGPSTKVRHRGFRSRALACSSGLLSRCGSRRCIGRRVRWRMPGAGSTRPCRRSSGTATRT